LQAAVLPASRGEVIRDALRDWRFEGIAAASLSLLRRSMPKRSEKKKAVGSKTSKKATATSVGVQGAPSCVRRDWLWGLILILAVILTYTPVWKAGFVWDDDAMLTTNPTIVGPLGLKEIWTTSAADICPLTLTTFWIEHALWGFRATRKPTAISAMLL
jgi:hypothetical protein